MRDPRNQGSWRCALAYAEIVVRVRQRGRGRGASTGVQAGALLVCAAWGSARAVADPTAQATEETCRFEQRGQVMALLGDCTTRTAIAIPDGMTLDGQHHRITARDPERGVFRGPVIANSGAEAHVRRVVVHAAGLAPTCSPGDELSAISLTNCSGSVLESTIEAVSRRGNACAEGTGIRVQADHGATPRALWIVGNRITGFARAGVSVAGHAVAAVQLNRVEGGRSTGSEAVLLRSGASGSLRWNTLGQLPARASGAAVSSAGVRIADTPGPVELSANRVTEVDVGIAIVGAGGVRVEQNALQGLYVAGVLLDGRRRPTTDNWVGSNHVVDSPWAAWLLGSGARANELELGADERLRDDGPRGDNHVQRRR